jgi:hypothetical protein
MGLDTELPRASHTWCHMSDAGWAGQAAARGGGREGGGWQEEELVGAVAC